jgi:hypothetical protein
MLAAASNGLGTPDILRAPIKHYRYYSMPHPRRRRHDPRVDRRLALELLASYRDGCTEALMTSLYAPDIRGSTNQTDDRCDHSNQ